MLGDLVQQGVTQSDYSITGMALAVLTFALLSVGVSWTSFRFPRLRPLLDGEPVVVVRDGMPIEASMRRERLTLGELQAAARLQSIASLDEVEWAVLETSGQISFVKRERGGGGAGGG